MNREMNLCIDCKAFASLILDYEYKEDQQHNLPAYVSCRVLIEDLFARRFNAKNREEAIEIFRSGKWKEA